LHPALSPVQRLNISRTPVVSAYRGLESRGLLRGYVGRGTFVCAAPEPEGTPFAWRGKIAAAALRSSDSTLRDLVRYSSDARLLSLAAGEPALDAFPNEAFLEATTHVLTTDPMTAWGHGPTEGRPRCAARSRIGSVPHERADSLGRAAGARSARAVPDRSGRRGHHGSSRTRAIHVPRRGRSDRLGQVRGDSDGSNLLVRYRPKRSTT
jgi:hypothetical protein